MDKKKLLLLASNLKQGGFQRVCARTAVLLKEYFEVYVIVFDGEDIAYPLEEIQLIDIKVKAQSGIINKIRNVCRRISLVKAIKKEKKIDISYSFGMSTNLINVLTRERDRIWCSIRSYIDLDTKTLSLVCRKADLMICCSKVLEDYIRKRYSDTKTVTIYNPFDVDELIKENQCEIDEQDKDFFESEALIVAAMGRQDVLKGYWHLIKAFSHVSVQEAKLCIVGNGEFLEEKKLVKDLGLAERVYFTGGKTNPFPYLKYVDVYVMSSIHEGFPNALVEAMALGLPVISTNCETGPSEILADDYTKYSNIGTLEMAEYGVLVPSMNSVPNYDNIQIEETEIILAEAIENLLKDRELNLKYQRASKERAKEFGTKEYVDAFCKLACD